MTEPFDAVLAEAERGTVWLTWESIRVWRDRLAAAHEAEVAERDAEITRIHALHNSVRSRLDEVQAAYLNYRARARAAERDAAEAVGLLWECRSSLIYTSNDISLKKRIDAFLSEQEGERENGNG